MHRREVYRAVPWFSGSLTLLRRFNAVIDTIANQMHEWIIELFDNRLVEFCFRAIRGHPDFPPQIIRQIADEPFKFCEQRPDRKHTDAECSVPQVCGEPFHLFSNRRQFSVILTLYRLAEALLYDYQLTHEVHKFIQLGRWH